MSPSPRGKSGLGVAVGMHGNDTAMDADEASLGTS
jgi:hypothetical protein